MAVSCITELSIALLSSTQAEDAHLALMKGLSLNLPLLLQTVNYILVSPTNLMRQTLDFRKGKHQKYQLVSAHQPQRYSL